MQLFLSKNKALIWKQQNAKPIFFAYSTILCTSDKIKYTTNKKWTSSKYLV